MIGIAFYLKVFTTSNNAILPYYFLPFYAIYYHTIKVFLIVSYSNSLLFERIYHASVAYCELVETGEKGKCYESSPVLNNTLP